MYMSGNKPWPQLKVWIGQVVWVLHHEVGGTMDGAKNINLMMKMEEKLNNIKIKTWESQTVSGCLDTRVGGKKVHLVTSIPMRDIVCWKWNIIAVHWLVLPVGVKCEPWAIALDVMLPSGYVRQDFLNNEIFHWLYFL